MQWTDFQLRAINHLGELAYTPAQIVMCMGLDDAMTKCLLDDMALPGSMVSIAYESGKAQAGYRIDRRLQDAIEHSGDPELVQLQAQRAVIRELEEERAADWKVLLQEKRAAEQEDVLMLSE